MALHDTRASDLERLVGSDAPAWRGHLPSLLAVLLALVTAAGVLHLRPSGSSLGDLGHLGVPTAIWEARVETIEEGPCEGVPELGCTTVTFRLSEGPDAGSTTVEVFPESESRPDFREGERVVLGHQPEAPPDFRYHFADRQRRPVLAWLALGFALAVVALGKLRGLAALVGLGCSITVLLWFVIPAILVGTNPVLVALVGASAIAHLALYLAHGLGRMTVVALLGTVATLALTAGLSALAVEAARISGFATEEALLITLVPGQIDVRGLVLAGMILGALGAIDDVTVTQASAVWELRKAAPELERSRLFRSGLRIGRDHIASTVNTLALAYAGAAMPLLILFVLSRQSLGTIANSEILATEILRTLVGSIGLVASVPITTWLAARWAPSAERPAS